MGYEKACLDSTGSNRAWVVLQFRIYPFSLGTAWDSLRRKGKKENESMEKMRATRKSERRNTAITITNYG